MPLLGAIVELSPVIPVQMGSKSKINFGMVRLLAFDNSHSGESEQRAMMSKMTGMAPNTRRLIDKPENI